MKWDKINFGYSITNVGKVAIPANYGNLSIESVYGPLFYSDVNEKTVGVITVGDKITYTLSYNTKNISMEKIKQIKDKFDKAVENALA